MIIESKFCSRCKTEKPVDKFYFYKGKPTTPCRKCKRAYGQERDVNYSRSEASKKWRKKNRFKIALYAYGKKAEYKSCNATVKQLEASFSGFCDACGVSEEDHGKKLHMDHDYDTGDFRGWLCPSCNHALGMCKDSVARLLALAGYLVRNQQKRE